VEGGGEGRYEHKQSNSLARPQVWGGVHTLYLAHIFEVAWREAAKVRKLPFYSLKDLCRLSVHNLLDTYGETEAQRQAYILYWDRERTKSGAQAPDSWCRTLHLAGKRGQGTSGLGVELLEPWMLVRQKCHRRDLGFSVAKGKENCGGDGQRKAVKVKFAICERGKLESVLHPMQIIWGLSSAPAGAHNTRHQGTHRAQVPTQSMLSGCQCQPQQVKGPEVSLRGRRGGS
jgi:hypothetical protein